MVSMPSELVVTLKPAGKGWLKPSVSVEVQVFGFAAIVMESSVPPPFSVTVAELNKLTVGFVAAESSAFLWSVYRQLLRSDVADRVDRRTQPVSSSSFTMNNPSRTTRGIEQG
jgi:hypothetical protein